VSITWRRARVAGASPQSTPFLTAERSVVQRPPIVNGPRSNDFFGDGNPSRSSRANALALRAALGGLLAVAGCGSHDHGHDGAGAAAGNGSAAMGGAPASGGAGGSGGTVGSGASGGTTGGSGASAAGGTSAGGTANGSGGASGSSGASGTSGATSGTAGAPEVTGPYRYKSVRTGASGGFVVDVLFHPKEKDLVYAKTDIGGVYRFSPADGGWIQLMTWVSTEQWGYTGGESVALDPMDPARLYVAAGTYTNGWDPNNGAILRSTDRGATFAITPMPFKMGGNMPGRGMGERLAVDPNDDRILYFGARDGHGLWRSEDFGETWAQVTNFPDVGPYAQDPNDTASDYLNHPVGIPWLIFDPLTGTPGSATKTIYVGVAQNAPGKPNLYRSTDAGATWEAIPGQPSCAVSGTTVTCTGGATWDMSATGDDGTLQWNSTGYLPHQGKVDAAGTLYVTLNDFAGPYNGNVGDVWKFEPESSTWTQISPVPGSKAPADLWWGYGGLAVDWQHPGTLVVSAVNSWWPEGNLWRTTDGGMTWTAGWEWTSYPERNVRWQMDISTAPWLNLGVTNPSPPDPAVKVGWMMEGMNIDPFDSDRLLYGTGATLYGTRNLTNWDKGQLFTIENMAVGMEETSVLGLVSPPSGDAHLFSVMGDVGGFRHDELDTAPATSFTIPYSGTFNDIDFAEANPSFMVRVGTGKSSASPPYHGTAFTTDGGKTWFQGNVEPAADKGAGTVAAAADGSRVLWASNDPSVPVSYSADLGNSWQACAGVPNAAVVASDRVNAKRFYAFGDGKFWLSTDAGATFTASPAAALPSSAKLEAVPGKEGEVWLTGGAQMTGGATSCEVCGLWRTTDGGASFTKLAGVTKADVVGFGMPLQAGGPPAAYLAGAVNGGRGLFRSDDAGAAWSEISDAKHQFATVQAITGDPRIYGRVYVGTNGLGIFYGDLAP
jgi:hypothetical protein